MVFIKAVITELFHPPAFGCGIPVGFFNGVLVEDEVHLYDSFGRINHLRDSSVFFFACIFSLTSWPREADDLVNASLMHYRELRSGVLRTTASSPYHLHYTLKRWQHSG
jgi:hypothetical protein